MNPLDKHRLNRRVGALARLLFPSGSFRVVLYISPVVRSIPTAFLFSHFLRVFEISYHEIGWLVI